MKVNKIQINKGVILNKRNEKVHIKRTEIRHTILGCKMA